MAHKEGGRGEGGEEERQRWWEGESESEIQDNRTILL